MFLKSYKIDNLREELNNITEINKKLKSDRLELLQILTSILPCTISTNTILLIEKENCYIIKFNLKNNVFYTDILESNYKYFEHIKKEEMDLENWNSEELFYDLCDGWAFKNISKEVIDDLIYLDEDSKNYLKLKFLNKYLNIITKFEQHSIINKITGSIKYKNLSKIALNLSESLYQLWYLLGKKKKEKLEKIFEELSNVKELENDDKTNITK